jgi:hypothetical protein
MGTLETYRRSLRKPVARAALLATHFGRRPDPPPFSGRHAKKRVHYVDVQSGSRLAARRLCAREDDITSEAFSTLLSGEDGRGGTFLTMWH